MFISHSLVAIGDLDYCSVVLAFPNILFEIGSKQFADNHYIYLIPDHTGSSERSTWTSLRLARRAYISRRVNSPDVILAAPYFGRSFILVFLVNSSCSCSNSWRIIWSEKRFWQNYEIHMSIKFAKAHEVARALCLPLFFVALAVCFLVEPINAQDAAYSSNSSATKGEPNPKDPFILGPWLPLRAYSKGEVIRWGADFIFAPSAAKDRVVLYAYDLAVVGSDFFEALQKQITLSDPDIAVVSNILSRKLTFLGNDVGYFCVPIILDGQNKIIVGDFIREVEYKRENRFLPAVIAVSALKTTGLDLDTMKEWSHLAFERPWAGVLGTSIPIPGPYKPTMYIASRAGWDTTKNPPETFATVSELENRISQYK